jgi:hypothetical protein
MEYKIVAMDMDDTLLTDDQKISEKTKEAIMEAQKSGTTVVLASGRPTYAMKKFAKELELKEYGGYILSYNGSIVIDCARDEVIFENCLSQELALELHKISQEHQVFYHTYIGDDIITTKNNKYTEIEYDLTGMKIIEVDNLEEKVTSNPVKALMMEDPAYLKQVEDRLRPLLESKVNLFRSKPFFLEFTAKGVDKGAMLAKLADRLGVRQNQVIAIGDGYNDLTMIQYAGLGVAVDNANDQLKKKADYITTSNMEDGVAKVIEEFIFAKRSIA